MELGDGSLVGDGGPSAERFPMDGVEPGFEVADAPDGHF